MTKLSYALEVEVGLNSEPAPRRVVSLAFHAISAALLFLLIVRLVPGAGPMAAAFLAALWFIHPVHADNVLMLSGRTAVLSGMFLLAALVAFEESKSWLAALLFMLACFSRETALAGLLPLAVLAASRPGSSWRSAWRELAPALVGAALVLAWILTTPRYLQLAEFSLLGRPFWSSLVAQVGAVPVGLALLFNPSALSIDYGLPLPSKFSEPLFLLGAALYLGAGVAIVWLVRVARSSGPARSMTPRQAASTRKEDSSVKQYEWRAFAMGFALWVAALLPTQSVIPKLDPLTNRPLALALAGLLLLTVPLLDWARRGWRSALPAKPDAGAHNAAGPTSRRLVGVCAALVFIALITATFQRAGLFGSDLHLWQDAAAKSLTNTRPHLHHALRLWQLGRKAEARQVLARAQRIDPFDSAIAAYSRAYRVLEVPE